MKIEIEGIKGTRFLRDRIVRGVRRALSRQPAEPATALVSFTDINGPKGGIDIRCAVTVSLPSRPTVRVEHLATTEWLAFSGAADTLERRLRRQREREEVRRRRPKKYYVAKTLIAPESAAPGGPTPRRARRRPV